jgi:hypothetical protein
MNTTPGPDSDPCSGVIGDGMAYHFSYGQNKPNQPICFNPFAHTTGETCVATFTVITGTQKGVDEVIAEANERLGGPIFVMPLPSNPEPGGCAGDPRCTP